jgi:hypothetical protein
VTSTTIGTVGSGRHALVDARGRVTPVDAGWSLDWWIGADDRWHRPADEPSTRQTLVDFVPVVRTAVRVPGGDAAQHAYALGGDVAVVDVANESPTPFVLALVVRGAGEVELDGATVRVDGRPALVAPRAPARWATTRDGTTEEVVRTGRASSGPFPRQTDGAARLEAAFLYPVPHRARLRVGVPLGPEVDPIAPTRLAGPADAVRGWRAQLARGMRVQLPDARLVGELRAACAAALLDADAGRVDPFVVAALEDWGFDTEAAAAWSRLGWRARRAAARRPSEPPRWSDVVARGEHGAGLLLTTRAMLAHEGADDRVTLLGDLPPGWRGQPIEVHDVPIRLGVVSYAVRWHGAHPALLWEAPPGVRLRAPGLDPAWTSEAPRGEARLGARVA